MKSLVIVPCYNEQDNILQTVKKLKNLKSNKIDYIVINDGSKDNTLDILDKNKINYINLQSNLGIGGCVQTGYKYAFYNNYDIAIQFDGDGQHNENYIKDLIKEVESGNDFVIGSRYISEANEFNSTFMRRLGKSVITFLIKLCTGKTVNDPTSGFRACNKKIIKEFASDYPIDYPEPDTIVKLLKKGYSIKEIPVEMNPRLNGESSIGPFKSLYYMVKVSLSIIISSLNERREK